MLFKSPQGWITHPHFNPLAKVSKNPGNEKMSPASPQNKSPSSRTDKCSTEQHLTQHQPGVIETSPKSPHSPTLPHPAPTAGPSAIEQSSPSQQQPRLTVMVRYRSEALGQTQYLRKLIMPNDATVSKLKGWIEVLEGHPVISQKLTWSGRELMNGEVLREAGVKDWDVVDFEKVEH